MTAKKCHICKTDALFLKLAFLTLSLLKLFVSQRTASVRVGILQTGKQIFFFFVTVNYVQKVVCKTDT